VTVHPRPRFSLPLPGRAALALGERSLVMGIINVTPDSFADGGLRFDAGRAVADGLQMAADGADILDIGGESTRPGAEPLPEDEELRRVLPVVARLSKECGVPISVDTYKASVARQAVDLGAAMVNDISAFEYDADMARTVAACGAAAVLMHNRGRSRDMYRQAAYDDVTSAVAAELGAAIERAGDAGVPPDRIVVDPGIGFAKRAEHSFEILARLETLAGLGRPILVGPSRKSFLKMALGERPADGRDWGTAAAVTAAILGGAHIVRVHAVREMADAARVADRIRAAAVKLFPG
jgi:dihydropteroate synthase